MGQGPAGHGGVKPRALPTRRWRRPASVPLAALRSAGQNRSERGAEAQPDLLISRRQPRPPPSRAGARGGGGGAADRPGRAVSAPRRAPRPRPAAPVPPARPAGRGRPSPAPGPPLPRAGARAAGEMRAARPREAAALGVSVVGAARVHPGAGGGRGVRPTCCGPREPPEITGAWREEGTLRKARRFRWFPRLPPPPPLPSRARAKAQNPEL